MSPAAAARGPWKRLFLALALYALLLGAWPLVAWAYRPAFRAAGEFLFGAFGFLEDVRVEFEPGSGGAIARDTPHMDTLILLEHKVLVGPPAKIPASAFFHAYHPTAVLLALFLGATTLDWRRRRARLVGALLLLHLFIALRLSIAVLYAYRLSNAEGRPMLEIAPATERFLYWMKHLLWVEPATTYLAPASIWALLALGARPIALDGPPGRG